MTHIDLLNKLYDRLMLNHDESVVLAQGFDKALVGITATAPKVAVYDYWKCIDILLRSKDLVQQELDFDTAIVYLDEYIDDIKTIKLYAPIFIKTL
tara:strand:+ start:169 stop:456 length:288 start_codon:yes stop_codon:yes gene_type:complete